MAGNRPDVALYHGDCLEVMPLLEAGSIDMVLCDLPYGMTDCKWDLPVALDRLWPEYRRLVRKGGVVALNASQPFTSLLVMSNLRAFKTEWIWKKNAGSNFGTVKVQPMKEHESVLIFCDARGTYNPIMQERAASGLSRVKTPVNYATKAEVYANGGLLGNVTSNRPNLRYPSSVQNFNRERGLHPTQKPVAWNEYLIRTYSNKGDAVLDNTMGSGSTGVACLNTGRRFVGIERDAGYFSIAQKRLSETRTVAQREGLSA